MIANDVLRRLRYIFDLSDSKMISLSSNGKHKVTRVEISSWLKKDDDPDYSICSDTQLAILLNNLITEKRGKRDGPQPEPETRLSNNMVFMKLKIALNLKAEEVLEILNLAGFKLGKHELSAFFRKPGHKHFRECKDQVLRNFLQGLAVKHRNITNKSVSGVKSAKQPHQLQKEEESQQTSETKAPSSFYKKKINPK
jgi:uncharacterized protein YehS (DUF1456 family)